MNDGFGTDVPKRTQIDKIGPQSKCTVSDPDLPGQTVDDHSEPKFTKTTRLL